MLTNRDEELVISPVGGVLATAVRGSWRFGVQRCCGFWLLKDRANPQPRHRNRRRRRHPGRCHRRHHRHRTQAAHEYPAAALPR